MLHTLAGTGATQPDLQALVLQSDDAEVLSRFYYYLNRLQARGLLSATLMVKGQPLATLLPLTGVGLPQHESAEARYVLSRFAYCRRDAAHFQLESPLAPARVLLHDGRAAALLAALAQPQDRDSLAQAVPGMRVDSSEAFLVLLAQGGMLSTVDATGQSSEETQPTLGQWEFHDLLFHSRSRAGRHDQPVGGTYRFLDRFPPTPAVKPAMSTDVIPLYAPDLNVLKTSDRPLTDVLEARRSWRQHGDPSITAQQLGEFLYRTARIRQVHEGPQDTLALRPMPGAGALYALELYLAVDRCTDVPAGLYHYAPQGHHLERLTERTPQVAQLLEGARYAAALSADPQVLMILAARFQRLAWKYTSIAYALLLKDVGVLYQTMYLVATAMDLAPCALGAGNADLFATAAALDYYAETSVGEFILGSKGPELRPPVQPAAPGAL
jgi:SagB-type dehydrogenase family enzyme